MIDKTLIVTVGGNGGNGSISGRREKFAPKGGPDGGDGGSGGSVLISSDPHLNTLRGFAYKRRFVAASGTNGSGNRRHGKSGDDIEVSVPVGTEVWSDEPESIRLADLTVAGESVLVSKGGTGGRGNSRFTTSTNQFPLLAEAGERGETTHLRLELKLLADVGIVGLPNAGKSSLLAAVSAARPKVAEYPFTTLEPVLGVVEHRDTSFVMVDIPGLIEGAHTGAGLGDEFLRHIERTRVIVTMVDASVERIMDGYVKVMHELREYGNGLSDKPRVVCLNKVDIPGVTENAAETMSQLRGEGEQVHLVSAVGRLGLADLLDSVVEALSRQSAPSTNGQIEGSLKAPPVLRPRPVDDQVEVRRHGRRFLVESKAAGRIAAMVDASNWNAMIQLREYLRRTGVLAALEKAGIRSGQHFRVGPVELEWD